MDFDDGNDGDFEGECSVCHKPINADNGVFYDGAYFCVDCADLPPILIL